MKKIALATLALVVLAVGYWLISPLFITRKVSESLPQPAEKHTEAFVVAQGTFEGLAGHAARGTASLVRVGTKYYLRFEDDFYVTNGPDLFVHFGKNGAYDAEARLGALKGNEGSQNYEVPAGINLSDYTEAWVWCRTFSVPFGKAVLKAL